MSPVAAAVALAGPESKRYQVAYSSFLATPTTQAAENFAPLQWRARSTPDDPSQASTHARPPAWMLACTYGAFMSLVTLSSFFSLP